MKIQFGISQRSLLHDYTEVTSYSLDYYEQIKDIKGWKIFKKFNGKYKGGNDICLEPFNYLRC